MGLNPKSDQEHWLSGRLTSLQIVTLCSFSSSCPPPLAYLSVLLLFSALQNNLGPAQGFPLLKTFFHCCLYAGQVLGVWDYLDFLMQLRNYWELEKFHSNLNYRTVRNKYSKLARGKISTLLPHYPWCKEGELHQSVQKSSVSTGGVMDLQQPSCGRAETWLEIHHIFWASRVPSGILSW